MGLGSFVWRGFRGPRLVTVLRLTGAIGSGGRFSRGLEDAWLAPLIEKAFKPSRLAAVALAINSPGGAPAQSALIARRIRDHAAERKVPVFAFCEDVAASGGYMLACAADEIWVEENSIVGSIGVVSSSFGFVEAMKKLGVERRLQTAGESKARLDPFSPRKPEDEAWLAALQRQIHENFIEMVKASRGDRLGAEPPAELFSGEVYLGAEAVRLGLADGVGRLKSVIKERFGEETRLEPISPRRGLFSRIGFGANSAAPGLGAGAVGGGFAEQLLEALETRALWDRFGL